MEEAEEKRQLSLRLFDILERVGASEEMRLCYRTNIVTEIVCTIATTPGNHKYMRYIFGSFSEGTSLPDLGSDVDMLKCFNDLFVHADILTSPDGRSLLLVHEGSYPGYVKLQAVLNRHPLDVYHMEPGDECGTDSQGRICLKNYLSQIEGHQRHGPAASRDLGDGLSVDQVLALRCVTVPGFAKKWTDRCRRNGWPPQQLLTLMSNMNCFVVGVGHEASPERHLEWRLSFSLQERELMFHLNPVQHKCYILMKAIKKDVVQPEVGEEVLTSYHCKTILFHVIENNPRDIWRPDNLIHCLMLCFLYMYRAVDAAYCPLFFLTDANLFDRESFRQKRPSLLLVLENIIKLDYRVVLQIKCSGIGYSFIHNQIHQYAVDNLMSCKMSVNCEFAASLKLFDRSFCHILYQKNGTPESIQTAYNILRVLTDMQSITDHSEQQTKEAMSWIIPRIHHRLAISIAAYALESRDFQKRERLLHLFERHFRYISHVDMITATLTYATVMYSMGEYELCRDLLEEKEGSLSEKVISICGCRDVECYIKKSIVSNFSNNDISQHTFMKKHVSSCIIFLPSEHKIIHPALKLEMIRSLCTITGSRNEIEDSWFDLAVVDGKVYLYFLEYLVYSRLNKPNHKQVAMDNLKWVIGDDKNLCHKETAYNLLGWIYKEENRVEEAVQCWKKSWEIRPDHNAAKWHYALLMMNRQGSQPPT